MLQLKCLDAIEIIMVLRVFDELIVKEKHLTYLALQINSI